MLGQLGANTCHPPSTVSSHIFSSLYKSMPADHNHLHHYTIQRFKAQVACAYTWLSTCRCACQSSGHGESVDDGVQSTSESSVAGFISYGDVWWFFYVGMNESRCRRWWNLVGGVFGVGRAVVFDSWDDQVLGLRHLNFKGRVQSLMCYHVLVRQLGLVLKHQCIIEVYTSLFLSSLYVKRYMYYVCQYNTSDFI